MNKMMKKIKEHCVEIILAAIISLFIVLGRKVVFNGNVAAGLDANYFKDFIVTDLFVFILSFIVLFVLISFMYIFIGKIKWSYITVKKKEERKLFFLFYIIFSLFWLPYLLSFAPGSVLGDSFSSIHQIMNHSLSNHHPVFYTLIIGFFMKAGSLFGGINVQIFLYTCFQYTVMAASLAYAMLWMYRRGVPKWVMVIFCLYYGVMPFFPSYAIIMWKDPLFSIAIMWYGFLLYEAMESRENFNNTIWLIKMGFFSALVIFLRNNGIYIVVLTTIACCIFCSFKMKRYMIMTTGILLVSIIIQGPVYDKAGVKKESVESLGVPLQQLAYTVIKEENKLSEEQKQILDRLYPLEMWGQTYAPCRIDNIKWNHDFNAEYLENNTGTILKIWIALLPKCFGSYVKAYCLETVGFWHPYMQNKYGYIDIYIADNQDGVHEIDLFNRFFHLDIRELIHKFKPQLGTGTLFIIMLIMWGYCIKNKKKNYNILFVPAFGCWLTIMIATPVAFSLRYVYIMALQLPVYLTVPFFSGKSKM